MLQRINIACYSTPKIDQFWQLFRESLTGVGLEEKRILHQQVPDLPEGGSGFRSDQWYDATAGKVEWFADQLQTLDGAVDFAICSDVDIWFPKGREEKWKEMELFLDSSPSEVFAAREPWDGDSGPSNTGFLIIKSSYFSNMSAYLRNVSGSIRWHISRRRLKRIRYADQTIINRDVIAKKLPFEFLPNHLCSLGDPGIRSHRKTMIFHHACGANTSAHKVEQFKRLWKALGEPNHL